MRKSFKIVIWYENLMRVTKLADGPLISSPEEVLILCGRGSSSGTEKWCGSGFKPLSYGLCVLKCKIQEFKIAFLK
jgi:hypothetical protein